MLLLAPIATSAQELEPGAYWPIPKGINIFTAANSFNTGDMSFDPAAPILEGVQLVLRQILTAFERLDVTAIDAANQPFDPNLHEAISQAESDAPPGTVVQVLQRGYKAGDRLLRPAMVVVAKPKSAPE